jgi:hypothetical protein
VPSQEETGQNKNTGNQRGGGKIDGDVQGVCRKWEKIDESNVVVSGAYMLQSFAYRYDSEE